jgi:hypothetical protein
VLTSMADTPSEAAMDGPGPSTTTMGASDKRPQCNETEEPDFDVTNPYHRESHCNTIPEEDIKERLADLELKIGTNTPKTDKAQ